MLRVRNIVKKYKDKRVISSFSYIFRNKRLYIIGGKSGCGKSTLLNILSLRDPNYKGDILVKGSIFYLNDKDNLISSLTVKENLYLFELVNEVKINYLFDIKYLLNKKVKHLSQGEKQLIELVLAFNSKEDIIIMDEPFTALSYENKEKCAKFINQLKEERLIIIASHEKEFFKDYTFINLEEKKKKSIKKFKSAVLVNKKKYKAIYSLYYMKKTILSKLLFVFSLLFSLASFIFVNNYSNKYINKYLKELRVEEGIIVEKISDNIQLSDNTFYEISKRLSSYITNYNGNYYSASLYNKDIVISNYYIDSGISLASFEYIEESLGDNEVVMGFNYHTFCRKNSLYNCDESYIKSLLVNKEIKGFNLYVKDVVNSDYTIFYTNKRFFRVTEENDYVEYYLDMRKDYIEEAFSKINSDEMLSNFSFVKIKESEECIRYRVEKNNVKTINSIDYNNYIVCLDKGYNCNDYLKHFSSLMKIDNYSDVSNLQFRLIEERLKLNEIVISSKFSKYLNKKEGETIRLYFDYNGFIKEVPLIIKKIINDDSNVIYHNSYWTYSFFKEIVGLDNRDLKVEKIMIFEDIKDGYRESENIYKDAINEITSIFNKMKKVTFSINVMVTICSVIVILLLEIYYNKFKKEYFNYLKRLNVEKKNA